MTRDAWRESATKDVLFPDDVEGYGPLSVVGEPLPASEADTDTVEYGVVAELEGDHHEEKYLVTPQALRAAIADAWRPDEGRAVFEVLEAEKDGDADDDPWLVDIRILENGDPL